MVFHSNGLVRIKMIIKTVLAITLLLCIVAWSSDILPSEDAFGVEIIVSPKTIQTFQEIEFEARLINKANHIYTINHADDIFFYNIYDSNGNNVNDMYMSMIGKTTILQGKGVASSRYKYIFDKPGQYEVWATARFTIKNSEFKRDYELNTTKMKLDIK
jgi:hypothetical protein